MQRRSRVGNHRAILSTVFHTSQKFLKFRPAPVIQIQAARSKANAMQLGDLDQTFASAGVGVTPGAWRSSSPSTSGRVCWSISLARSRRSFTNCRRSNLPGCSMGCSAVFMTQSLPAGLYGDNTNSCPSAGVTSPFKETPHAHHQRIPYPRRRGDGGS